MNAMNLSPLIVRVSALCAAIALTVLLPVRVSAQEMDHPKMQMPSPTATAPAKKKATDPHAGHAMPRPAQNNQTEPMDHAAMGHAVPKSPGEPREPIPAITPADRIAAFPDVGGHTVHDDSLQHYVLFNRLEAWDAEPGTGFAWEGQGWVGTDLNRLWARSDGERIDGETESADLEVLYGRSIARWWDVVAGVRHDFQPGSSQTFAAIGVIGLAPYKFEIEATAYFGESGQTAARLEAEYELLLTNRLILQPLIEVSLYGQNDERRGIGSDLSNVEVGLRLRYEIRREFAPYIGVNWEKVFGGTADFARARGEAVDDRQFVIGLRAWF